MRKASHFTTPLSRASRPFAARLTKAPLASVAIAILALLLPGAGIAANLLVNPSFEANAGHVIPSGWTRFAPTNAQPFGNYWVESGVPAQQGTLYWKQWGASYVANSTNVAGLQQTFSSTPGSTYQASGWFYTRASDVLGAHCMTWLEVAFLGANNAVLALYKSADFTAGDGTDTWLQFVVNQVCNLAAPLPPGDLNYPRYAVTGTVSQLVAPLGTTQVRFRYAYSQAGTQGGSAYFDSAVLDQVGGPQPPVISQVFPREMIFINPADGLSFNVSSPSGFTINPDGIGVVLNGSNVSPGLEITGSASDKNVAYHGLLSNLTYNVSITVTDSFGFTASTTTSFETTWVDTPPLVYLWEAEDWDFDGGQYLNHPELCNESGNPNCYFGKVGVEGVDEHSVGSGGNRLYRPDDAIATGIAGDRLRKNLVAADRPDYRIDPFIGGSWLNYTRDWSNGTYWVVARLATGEGLAGSLTLSLVNPDTSTTELGKFTITSGRGWSSFDNILLRDTNGNPVAITLNGKATLRVTSGGNLLPNFFALAPAQLDLPLLSGLYPTGTRPFEHTNALSFNLTTVGADFPPGSIKLHLDGHDVSSALVITGPPSNPQVVYPHLLPNARHSAVITATNSLGNGLCVTNHFDTFSQANYMVETEDFDYDGGQFVADALPGYYLGLAATTNVDFQHRPIEGEQFVYRADGIPHEIARDFIRQAFIDWGAIDYHLAWFGGGDWVNYTREYPTNAFFVYARSAGFGSYAMSLDEVIAGAGTENQTTRPLGQWSAVGKDNQTHAWVQLTDAGLAAPTVVNLRGLGTLRLSTSTGNCHPSYLMFVPASGIPLSAAKVGGSVQLSFPTQAGVVYRVFQRTDVHNGAWSLLTTVLGDGSVKTVNDPATTLQRFYKVVAP
ncbi:MAG TPA: hypothetical protein VI136_26480 [Verrucomicrobiae bacterium]